MPTQVRLSQPNSCCVCGIMFLKDEPVVFIGSSPAQKTAEGRLEFTIESQQKLTLYHNHCWNYSLG